MSDMSDLSLASIDAGGLLPRAASKTGFVPPQRFILVEQFKGVMLEALAHDASDVYIQPGLPIWPVKAVLCSRDESALFPPRHVVDFPEDADGVQMNRKPLRTAGLFR